MLSLKCRLSPIVYTIFNNTSIIIDYRTLFPNFAYYNIIQVFVVLCYINESCVFTEENHEIGYFIQRFYFKEIEIIHSRLHNTITTSIIIHNLFYFIFIIYKYNVFNII